MKKIVNIVFSLETGANIPGNLHTSHPVIMDQNSCKIYLQSYFTKKTFIMQRK